MGHTCEEYRAILLTLTAIPQIDNATKKDHSEKFFNETIDRIHPW